MIEELIKDNNRRIQVKALGFDKKLNEEELIAIANEKTTATDSMINAFNIVFKGIDSSQEKKANDQKYEKNRLVKKLRNKRLHTSYKEGDIVNMPTSDRKRDVYKG